MKIERGIKPTSILQNEKLAIKHTGKIKFKKPDRPLSLFPSKGLFPSKTLFPYKEV